MEIKEWVHKNVSPDGFLKTGGRVKTEKGICTSQTDGCTIKTCRCVKGHWVSLNFGYDKKQKTVSGITLYCTNKKEYNQLLTALQNAGV
jgi:spore coat protein U-like protein